MSAQYDILPTPRVISPSPTPSDTSGKEGYFPPATRSKTATITPIEEGKALQIDDPEFARARSRSRSPQIERRPARQTNGGITTSAKATLPPTATQRKKGVTDAPKGQAKGLLSPDSAYPRGFGSAYWRNLSRSPSPLGLIPIHREWRQFIHKHEIPRKVLHVSIGFVTLFLYYQGVQTSQIHPTMLYLLIPIFTTDLIRFRWPAFNRFYIRCLGPFMREAEAHDRFNGVISYLAGLWAALRFCRKDVAIMSIVLLSWCDTAASTFGRLWGKYTPRIRRGKSLAGSIAAFVVGVASAALFWGAIAPLVDNSIDSGVNSFAFQGTLVLPSEARERMHLSKQQATISGPLAVTVLSVVSGFVASVSEALDVFHLDDNLTIPVFCGIGLGSFLWAFAGS